MEDLGCHEEHEHSASSIHNFEEEDHDDCTFALWEADDSHKVSSSYESSNLLVELNEQAVKKTEIYKENLSSLKHSRAPPFFLS